MRTIVFSDLDGTLFRSKKQLNIEDLKVIDQLNVGSYTNENEPYSFYNNKDKLFIEKYINSSDLFVPVTMRNMKEFNKVNYNIFKKPEILILSIGAEIYYLNKEKNEYELDYEWIEKRKDNDEAKKIKEQNEFNKIMSLFKNVEHDFKIEIKDNLYIDIKRLDNSYFNLVKNFKDDIIPILNESKFKKNYYIYNSGRHLCIIPNYLKKEYAVEYIIKKHDLNNDLKIGIGDNKNDLGFMKLCNWSIFPQNSNIEKTIKN